MTTRKTKKNEKENTPRRAGLRFEVSGVLLIVFGIFSLLSLAGMDVGVAGEWTRDVFLFLFGKGAFFPALVMVFLGGRYIYTHRTLPLGTREVVWTIYFILVLVTIHWWNVGRGDEFRPDYFPLYGGLVGGAGLLCLRTLFGEAGVQLSLVAIAVINTIVLTSWTLSDGMRFIGKKTSPHLHKARESVKEKWEEHREQRAQEHTSKKQSAQFFDFSKAKDKEEEPGIQPEQVEILQTKEEPHEEVPAEPVLNFVADQPAPPPTWKKPEPDEDTAQVKPDLAPAAAEIKRADYRLPPLKFLHKAKNTAKNAQREVEENAAKLERLLASFGVEAKIIHASRGPSVTRYELEPGIGVKVSKIVNLADDIALQLAATDVRIEAPIPGKAAVGIEVPNKEVGSVTLREVLECDDFRHSSGGVVVGLGEDITGQPVVTDLAKMPHLLVAGSTGSGKSVCINTLIASILFRSYPDEVKLILIDPKVVELANYNNIPHLLTPVVTDPKKAAGVLRWAVREMENRYRLFAEAKVRNVSGYNEANPDKKLPLVVIIIDELADLMMVAPGDVEDAICRLAQMARAAGLHLVLATQRPSVDVITGTIKANIPSRISFAVSSQIDSRTILDMAGAEKLLGKGDMLFYPIGAPKPRRVQGAFISDEEVEALVAYIKEQAQPHYNDSVVATEEKKEDTPRWDDELLGDAIRMVLDTEQASVSMLQRRFRIGYTRAGRLIDTMESMGIVGPSVGSKPRDILITPEQAEQLLQAEESHDGDR